ncbi:MAG: hypothetical protein NTX03_14790 [Bacteroidetes bacterium]|nr:hypothetical protein [Bacteroidota bacterium]
MKKYWMARALKIGVLVALAALVFSYAVMMLWNALVPELFHGPHITWIQGVGLLILSKILFGGHKGGGWRRGGCGCGGGVGGEHWKAKWHEKWQNMNPEEKEKFKKYFGNRCGWESPETEKPEAES